MKKRNSNSKSNPLVRSHRQVSKSKAVFKAFSTGCKTMRMVEIEIGVRVTDICGITEEWIKRGTLRVAKYGTCPVSNHPKVGFYTTDKKQFPTSKSIKK